MSSHRYLQDVRLKMKLKLVIALLAVVALCASLVLWSTAFSRSSDLLGVAATVTVPATIVVPTTVSDHAEVTVAVVGDVLSQTPLLESVHDQETDSYDFTPVLAPVKSYLQYADFTVAGLETQFAGAQAGYGVYPGFNSPGELAGALEKVGVDLVATASGHSLDYGYEGIVNTLNTLEGSGIEHVGSYRSSGERSVPMVKRIKGINIGFVNYTTRLDESATSKVASYVVDTYDLSRAADDVGMARLYGADVVIALINYGGEFDREPTDDQVEVARALLSVGVDVVVGLHPNVVQPITHVLQYEGSIVSDKYVIYSVGNLVSAQRWRYSDNGIVAYIRIKRDGLRVTVAGINYMPVYVQVSEEDDRESYRVLPVLPTSGLATDTPVAPADRERMGQVWEDLYPLLYSPNENITPLDPLESGL
jgi:poly-gamma-glutamate capsule biosynthesis protein CapA/YwtB (metallophosphatase superfamily)